MVTDPGTRPSLSVAIITYNEETNIRRTLESVKWADEIVIVDSGSTDRTCDVAREYGAKVFVERWKGFAAQKNSAIAKCTGEWILSLDADEEVSEALAEEITATLPKVPEVTAKAIQESDSLERAELVAALEEADQVDIGDGFLGFALPRRNFFLRKLMRHGGFYPDRKLRLIRSGYGSYKNSLVHESMILKGVAGIMKNQLIHHAYPTLTSYIEHMNRYSSLGAEMVQEKKGRVGFNIVNILLRPGATFVYNYFFRLGFLDGKEGLLLHLYHAVYVSWKYAKAWELSRMPVARERKADSSARSK